MHSTARLRKVSGLIHISSGPGNRRRILRRNSAVLSASRGFSHPTAAARHHVIAERASTNSIPCARQWSGAKRECRETRRHISIRPNRAPDRRAWWTFALRRSGHCRADLDPAGSRGICVDLATDVPAASVASHNRPFWSPPAPVLVPLRASNGDAAQMQALARANLPHANGSSSSPARILLESAMTPFSETLADRHTRMPSECRDGLPSTAPCRPENDRGAGATLRCCPPPARERQTRDKGATCRRPCGSGNEDDQNAIDCSASIGR